MLLPIYIFVLNKNRIIKGIVLAMIIIWSSAVAISRVVIGAHYATDVTFGSFFIIVTFVILFRRYTLEGIAVGIQG
jgi:membrane-associated phospholipid phosphatase